MTTHCLNCNTPLIGQYCPNCGQPADTHRINSHYLWHDIQHGFLHVDKGLVFTTKELFTRPGYAIREFMEGKRVRHFKPISFVLVLAGLYGLLSHYFNINMLSSDYQITGSGENFNRIKQSIDKMSDWLSEHYSILALGQIPIFAIGTYFAFRKVGYNFIEHLVINTFLTGQRLLVHIISFPLYYLFNNTSRLIVIDRIISVIGYALFGWALFQIFNGLRKSQRIWRTIGSLAISFLILFLLSLGVFEVVVRSLK